MMKSQLPADLDPATVVALGDTREQEPLNLHPLSVSSATLPTGDYSISGLQDVVAIERKSLDDLLGCIGQSRERFDREILRLLAYPTRAVVVEASWRELEAGNWRSKITPAAACGSVLGWIGLGIPFLFATDHASAGKAVSRMLFLAARRRYREARALVEGVQERQPVRSRNAVAPETVNSFCVPADAEGSSA